MDDLNSSTWMAKFDDPVFHPSTSSLQYPLEHFGSLPACLSEGAIDAAESESECEGEEEGVSDDILLSRAHEEIPESSYLDTPMEGSSGCCGKLARRLTVTSNTVSRETTRGASITFSFSRSSQHRRRIESHHGNIPRISHDAGSGNPRDPPASYTEYMQQQAQTQPSYSRRRPPGGPEGMYMRGMDGIPPMFHLIMHEDAWPIDDPRRKYDFKDFMNKWQRRSRKINHLPSSQPEEPASKRVLRSTSDICYDGTAATTIETFDMQNIQWKARGLVRNQTLAARMILHPSKISGPRSQRLAMAAQITTDTETLYRFRSFMPRHRTDFNHYQLRNLVAATDRNSVFYASGNKIMRASMACPAWSQTVWDPSKVYRCPSGFKITCLATPTSPDRSTPRSDNVVMIGGFNGEYGCLNIDEHQNVFYTEGFVTDAFDGIVTHVHTYPNHRSGLLEAAFSSNDKQLRVLDIPTLEFTNTFPYDHAMNCTAVSTDGRLRVLVGDSKEVLITDVDKGNVITTLNEHTDHGFACAWARDGVRFATGAQDGKVVLWDARNWAQPLAVRHSIMKCARSLHFTDNGELVAAENEDVVGIYDRELSGVRQDIRFFGSIAGVALIDGGDEIVVSNSDRTVGGLLTFERQQNTRAQSGTGKSSTVSNPLIDTIL